MDQSSSDSRPQDEPKTSLAKTSSQRFSESNSKSFREKATSSAGYILRGEIDPSTYSFTTALKALQTKTSYTWENLSPDGSTLHSKWNDAERYICNPLSGQVPIECLSAKTLSERSLTMSSNKHQTQCAEITSQETKRDNRGSSSSLSPAPTPSIEERSVKIESGDSSISSESLKSETEVEEEEEENRCMKRKGGEGTNQMMMPRCSYTQTGCISLRGLWTRAVRKSDNRKSRTDNTAS